MPRIKNRKITATIQAVSAFIAGILITFSQSHNADIGMIALIVMSIGWVIAFGWAGYAKKEIRARVFRFVIAVASAAMIPVAFATLSNIGGSSAPIEGTPEEYAWGLLASWGYLGAIVELILAFYGKPGSSRRRDHFISAGLAALLGVAQTVTPTSDAVTHVGAFGAYAVILAVHLGLVAMSPAKKAGKKSGSNKTKSKK
jgi:hypothetical protein